MAVSEMWRNQGNPMYSPMPPDGFWNPNRQRHIKEWTGPNWNNQSLVYMDHNSNVIPPDNVHSVASHVELGGQQYQENNYFQPDRRRPFHNGGFNDYIPNKKRRFNRWKDRKSFVDVEIQTDDSSMFFDSILMTRQPESDWEKEILETYKHILQRGQEPEPQPPRRTSKQLALQGINKPATSYGPYIISTIDGWQYLQRRENWEKTELFINPQDFIIPLDGYLKMEDPRRSCFKRTVIDKLTGVIKTNRVHLDRFVKIIKEFNLSCSSLSSPEDVVATFLELPAFTTPVLASLYRLTDTTLFRHVFQMVNQFRQLTALGISSGRIGSPDVMNPDDS